MPESLHLALEFDVPPAHPPSEATGYVYFMEREGLIKIGYTTDVGARLKTVGKGSAMPPGMTIGPVVLLATVPGSIPDERHYHARFAAQRIPHTEWFRPTEELREFATTLAGDAGPTVPPRRLASRPVLQAVAGDDLGDVPVRRLAAELDVTMSFLHRKVRNGNIPSTVVGNQVCVTAQTAHRIRNWRDTHPVGARWPNFTDTEDEI